MGLNNTYLPARINNTFDFNGILQLSNFFVWLITIILFCYTPDPVYANTATIILITIMFLENILILFFEKRRRNPLILLLIFNIIVFYQARVATLLIAPSITYALTRRAIVNTNDINEAILYIIFSVFIVFLGLVVAPNNKVNNISPNDNKTDSKLEKIVLIIFAIEIVLSLTLYLNTGIGRIKFTQYNPIFNYLSLLFNISLFPLILFSYFFTYKPSKKALIYLVILLTIYFLIMTFQGSRSGILTLFLMILFCGLACRGKIEFKRKTIIWGLLIFIPLSVFAFQFATASRTNLKNIDSKELTVNDVLSVIDNQNFEYNTLNLLGPVFQRLGFLDMTAEMLSNAKEYKDVININYYAKSVVDGLTPGFDIFNVQKSSLALKNIYLNIPLDQKISAYHSDQFTLFGEYYLLFWGYVSLIALFFLALLFKTLYSVVNFSNPFLNSFAKASILYVYFNYWLTSFGMDWLITNTIFLLVNTIAVLIIIKLFKKYRIHRSIRIKAFRF